MGSIPGSGRAHGGGHGNRLQDSCWKNPMDRRAWQAIVHGVKGLDIAEVTEPTYQLDITYRLEIMDLTLFFPKIG